MRKAVTWLFLLCFITLSKTCCVDVLLSKCKVLDYNCITFKLAILNLHSKVNIFEKVLNSSFFIKIVKLIYFNTSLNRNYIKHCI